MFYGYALYYKDVDGFELPLFHRYAPGNDLVLVTPYKDKAQQWFDDEHEALFAELNPRTRIVKRGWWIFKRDEIIQPSRISADEFRFKARVFNTMFVKRVKLA